MTYTRFSRHYTLNSGLVVSVQASTDKGLYCGGHQVGGTWGWETYEVALFRGKTGAYKTEDDLRVAIAPILDMSETPAHELFKKIFDENPRTESVFVFPYTDRILINDLFEKNGGVKEVRVAGIDDFDPFVARYKKFN